MNAAPGCCFKVPLLWRHIKCSQRRDIPEVQPEARFGYGWRVTGPWEWGLSSLKANNRPDMATGAMQGVIILSIYQIIQPLLQNYEGGGAELSSIQSRGRLGGRGQKGQGRE